MKSQGLGEEEWGVFCKLLADMNDVQAKWASDLLAAEVYRRHIIIAALSGVPSQLLIAEQQRQQGG